MKKIVMSFCTLCVLACVSFVQAEEIPKFAGMAKVKVVFTDGDASNPTVIVEFLAVERARYDRYEDPVGKKFLIVPGLPNHAASVKKFLALQSVGDEFAVPVMVRDEKILDLLELTYEQRDLIK